MSRAVLQCYVAIFQGGDQDRQHGIGSSSCKYRSTDRHRSAGVSSREHSHYRPGRTIRRQAELMAQRIRANRREFLSTYRPATHITEMGQWHLQNRTATERATVDEFERIIQRAVARGVVVSNHLSNTARDISWPHGTNQQLDAIEARIRAMGASVIREPNAAGGRHLHVDW